MKQITSTITSVQKLVQDGGVLPKTSIQTRLDVLAVRRTIHARSWHKFRTYERVISRGT